MSRSDPIRTRYYDAVELADKISDGLFYVNAALSVASLLVEKQAHPIAYDWILIFFGVAVAALFTIGLFSRLYLTPRAEDKRRQDFFTSACGVSLTHEKTDGYYNNDFIEPIKRMAAQVLENSHFSKAIALRMARIERIKVIAYAASYRLGARRSIPRAGRRTTRPGIPIALPVQCDHPRRPLTDSRHRRLRIA